MSALSVNAKEWIPSNNNNNNNNNNNSSSGNSKNNNNNNNNKKYSNKKKNNKKNKSTYNNNNTKKYPTRRNHYKKQQQQNITTAKIYKGNNSKKNNKKSQQQINSAFLGFKYEREVDDSLNYFPSTVIGKRSQHKVHHPVFDRNAFLKATYRFVVSGPSASETNNPYMLIHNNKKVDWNDVEQVLFDLEDNNDFSCPICLCKPEVPLMNCCGHVYCMLCVLRLLENSNRKNWVKCAICNDPITKEKLRPTANRYITSIKPTISIKQHQKKNNKTTSSEKKNENSNDNDDIDDNNNNNNSNINPIAKDNDKSNTALATFKLMFRNKISTRSTFAYLSTITNEEWNNVMQKKMPTVKIMKNGNNNYFNEKEQLLKFTQFLRCTKEYIKSILCKEIEDLNKVVTEAKQDANFLAIIGKYEDSQKENESITQLDSLGRQMIAEKALKWELHELIETIIESEKKKKEEKSAKNNKIILDEEEYPSLGGGGGTSPNSKKDKLQKSTVESNLVEKTTTISPPKLVAPTNLQQQPIALNKIGSTETGFYFYQLEDGSKTFLHPFCVNLLKEEFKTYDNFPSELKSSDVLDIETVTLTKDKAKFYKYLSHLNLNAEIKLIEIDLNDLLSQATKNKFKKELQKRKRDRDKKMKEKRKNGNKSHNKSRDCPSPEMISAKIEKERKESLAPKNFPSVGSPPKIVLKEPALPAAYNNIGKKKDKSFANITKTMGFFPTLGEAAKTNNQSKKSRRAMSGNGNNNPWGGGSKNVWGRK